MDGTSARAVLGLSANASRQDIKYAYRRQAKAIHPDRGGSGANFAQLTAAYELAMAGVPRSRADHRFFTARPTAPVKLRSFAEELHRAMAY